jgi:hypothetical protein
MVVWMIFIIIEKLATTDNPWNTKSEISWLAFAGVLEGSGIARGTVAQRRRPHSLGCAGRWGRGLWIGIAVGVIIDCELGNWVVRREIRANHGKSLPLWINSLSLMVVFVA